MGRPAGVEAEGAAGGNQGAQMLDGFNFDISHQEVERILIELEEIYKSQAGKWLPIQGITSMLAVELGYEDEDEFEDALKGSFKDFLSHLPNVEVSNEESELQPGLFRDVFRVLPDPPPEERTPQKFILHAKEKRDLWRVLMKAPDCTIEIPELEFEIGADAKRHVDSVYNHITAAIFNLEQHAEQMGEAFEESQRKAIFETTNKLRSVLDLDMLVTFIVHDPTGLSAFKPADGIEIQPYVNRMDTIDE